MIYLKFCIKEISEQLLQIEGHCYSKEDHEIKIELRSQDGKFAIPVERVPAVEILDQQLTTTYDRAFFAAKFKFAERDFLKLYITDLCTDETIVKSLPKRYKKYSDGKDLLFYIRLMPHYFKKYGIVEIIRRSKNILFKKFLCKAVKERAEQVSAEDFFRKKLPVGDLQYLTPKVLIIGELSIPQCKYYRITQKVLMLKESGINTAVVSWTDKVACFKHLQDSTVVIFYRVPLECTVYEEMREARRLGIKVGFDIDDLIFDVKEYKKNSNLKKLTEAEQNELLKGAVLYQRALAGADFTIASTPNLQEYMKRHNPAPSYIIPNCICNDGVSQEFDYPVGIQNEIIIGYGSGTLTHDKDFEICSDAILKILQKFPEVKLSIHGHLVLPDRFSDYADRINRVDFVPFSEYSQVIKRFDINLIPLESTAFNDCKSNIKYLEASRHQIPSIASPAAEFSKVIQNGKNGFIATTSEEWYEALEKLILSDELRRKVGTEAQKTVNELYDSKRVFKRDFMPLLQEQNAFPNNPERQKKRILVVNVLYPPVSFGGATIVAENIVQQYKKHFIPFVFSSSFRSTFGGTVFTSRNNYDGVPTFFCEYSPSEDKNYTNPEVAEYFDAVLNAVRPDIVHFHSIQYLGVEMLKKCRKRAIPYFVTAHDAWWICERQFMLDANQKFCHQDQTGIDLYKCAECTKSKKLFTRWKELQVELRKSLLVLTPSDYMRNVYEKSGFPADLIRTNRNGVPMPPKMEFHKLNKPITFAYLGGKCYHKGYYFLQQIEKKLHGDYILKLVDINLKFNDPQININDWNLSEKIKICPPYNHLNMDDFYKGIDVLLFPSQWKESFGLTVREALARNIWVITIDAGGDIATDLHDGENGNLIPFGDKEAFRKAMQSLIDSPQLLENYKNQYRDKIRTPELQVEEIVTLLSEKGFNI